MIKKYKLPIMRSIWFYLHNPIVSLKNFYYKNEFFVRLLAFMRNNSYPSQKEMSSYITSRNMRRTLVPSDFMKEIVIPNQKTKVSVSRKKEAVGLIPLNFQQAKMNVAYPVYLNILKFHSKTMLLRNLVSKPFNKKETQEEIELNWGGPEIYKLITFIKNFEEILEKHSEVLVFFSAYWCQHCLKLRKTYGSAALMSKKANLPILFATFDITTDPDLAVEKGVVGIPLIKYYKQGKYFSTFTGKRTAEELFEFAKNPTILPSDYKATDI